MISIRQAAAIALPLALLSCKKAVRPEMVERDVPVPENSRLWKINSARGAAPGEVSKDALVIDYPRNDSTSPEELELGANGWTCWPDNPATPDEDPVCRDDGAREWMYAVDARRPPRIETVGVIYMLQGGNSVSDADPTRRAPDAGQPWVQDPPFVGIIMPNPQRIWAGLPTTRQNDKPWVRFAGTPWAYLVVPASARR